ncbi:MAG: geranylgeranylglyceryl/heptaprenylglyceryl phosphate synthase [Crenarchaeota archaeon]|nr:geranylgeranylglyceryl/heptaprenylglyceryl phosphate synthase [Thermoproteota archaeon]
MCGHVEEYLLEKIKIDGTIHVTLIDPEKVTVNQAAQIAQQSEASGTTAILIGGSTFASQEHLDNMVKEIKNTIKIPVILFPNNITGLTRYADAVLFMSLLNSVDPYFLMGVQILGAPLLKKYGIEPIPMGYIIVGQGGTAAIVGKAISIPYDKPDLAAAHALAGNYLGMRFIYLEGGSGAANPVPPEMIKATKSVIDGHLIVGGGIRTRQQAALAASAGADIIVTGNIVESADSNLRITEIIQGIKSVKS